MVQDSDYNIYHELIKDYIDKIFTNVSMTHKIELPIPVQVQPNLQLSNNDNKYILFGIGMGIGAGITASFISYHVSKYLFNNLNNK
jgi:hypothetical protein